MRVMKTVEVPARPATTKEVQDYVLCDLCAARVDRGYEHNSYEFDECHVRIEVRRKEGFSCPEGGDGTEQRVDLCPKCWKEKLIPWLESQGAKIEKVDWEW